MDSWRAVIAGIWCVVSAEIAFVGRDSSIDSVQAVAWVVISVTSEGSPPWHGSSEQRHPRRGTGELEPMAPTEAVDLYLEAREDDAADWTLTSHESRLRPFVEWCRTDGEIENMNDLSGRDLYHYRVWRREGNYSDGEVEELAPSTLETALSTLSRFLQFCGEIEAVHEDMYLKVPIPDLSGDDEVSDSKIVPDRVPPIVDYLAQYHYASRTHVAVLLMWHTGARIGGLRALDLRDCYLDEKPGLQYVHRPETETPLKNDKGSERFNRIDPRVAEVLEDYIEGPRDDVLDDHGRAPLLTTTYGRVSPTCLRNNLYKVTRPCWIGEECPHDKDPETCDWAYYDQASKCPSSRSPHDIRKARVTQYRNDGIHRGVVSDRLDASEAVLDKHYDRASEREKADRRWREINR
jgi:integrase